MAQPAASTPITYQVETPDYSTKVLYASYDQSIGLCVIGYMQKVDQIFGNSIYEFPNGEELDWITANASLTEKQIEMIKNFAPLMENPAVGMMRIVDPEMVETAVGQLHSYKQLPLDFKNQVIALLPSVDHRFL